MTLRCAPDGIKERMSLSSLHTVRVQKAKIGIAKDRNPEASSRELSLARHAKRQDQEPRQVSPGPNPEPRWTRRASVNDLAFLNPPIPPLAVALPRLPEKIEAGCQRLNRPIRPITGR
jgi:hypothetical protein